MLPVIKNNKINVWIIYFIVIASLVIGSFSASGWSAVFILLMVSPLLLLSLLILNIVISFKKAPFTRSKETYFCALLAFSSSFFLLGDGGDGGGHVFRGKYYYEDESLPRYVEIIGQFSWVIYLASFFSIFVILLIAASSKRRKQI